jgi:hypothetical protein
MAYLTAEITDDSKGPFSLAELFEGGSITGVTLAPTAPAKPASTPRQVFVQADPGNSTNHIYVGTDASMLPTSGGGAYSLAAGDSIVFENASLEGIFVSASASNIKVNVIAQGGFQ